MRQYAAMLALFLSSLLTQSCVSRPVASDFEEKYQCCGPCKPKYCCVWHCEMVDTVYKKKRCYRVPQPYQKCICRYEPLYDGEGCCICYEPKFYYETHYRQVPVYYFTNQYDRSPHYFCEVCRTDERRKSEDGSQKAESYRQQRIRE